MGTIPETQVKRRLGVISAWVLLGLGLLYLANPGAGLVEIIPDNIPLIGNLDEAGITAMVLGALRYLKTKE